MKSSFLNSMDKAKLTSRQKKRARRNQRKSLHKLRNEKREKELKEFAYALANNLPKSEIWFNKRFELNWFYKFLNFKSNEPFKGYIPDLISHQYKLIIEVDGSVHELEEQKIKDFKKDLKYVKAGYKVIRVIAYNDDSYNNCITNINTYLNTLGITEVTSQTQDIKPIVSKKEYKQNQFKEAINNIDLNKKLPF